MSFESWDILKANPHWELCQCQYLLIIADKLSTAQEQGFCWWSVGEKKKYGNFDIVLIFL